MAVPALLVVLATAGLGAAARAQGFEGHLVMRGDRVLAEADADRLFTPGSVQKLVVAAAALSRLGPEYRTTTRLASAAEQRGGILAGDLVLAAGGDPSWSHDFFERDSEEPLAELATALQARGVRRVQGDLVVDVARFPGRRYAAERPLAELGVGLAAPVAGVALDRGTFRVRIAPGSRIGEPASVRSDAPVKLINRTVTVGAERDGKGSVEFLPRWDEDAIVVRGEYPISEGPYRVDASQPSPETYVGERLRAHLARLGIGIAGSVRVAREPVPAGRTLASFTSPPLAEMVVPALRDSSNWLAEMLLQLLAREAGGEGRLDDGLELLGDFLVRDVGAEETGFSLEDASGLSPHDLLSPRTVARLLRYADRAAWGPALRRALSTPGSGTLAVWPRLPPLSAKTGTIHNTLALAGYLDTGESETTVFVAFLNHDVREMSAQRRQLAERLRQWFRLALDAS